MDISLGIYATILIFIYLIIPGYIARRFYFHGEFSKQINLSNNTIIHIVYSSFIGLILVFTYIFALNYFKKTPINLDEILTNFDANFLSEKSDNSPKKDLFIGATSNIYSKYLPFLLSLYFLSGICGYFLSKTVLFFGLDTKYKFLRFSNCWHYVFNGKIFKFKKDSLSSVDSNLKVKYTFVDVLVSGEAEKPTLYSGLLADYDLCPNNINKIERIHLLKATRYKKSENSTELKNIPGNLFTIIGDKILNINCTYVCFEIDEIKNKKFNKLKNIIFLIQLISILVFLFSAIMLLFSIQIIDTHFFHAIINKSVIYKIGIIFFFNVAIGLITPFNIDRIEKKVNFIGLTQYIILLLITGIIAFILNLFW